MHSKIKQSTSHSQCNIIAKSIDRIEFVNILRGVAVLCVLISHYLSTFWFAREVISSLLQFPVLEPEITTPYYVTFLNSLHINYGCFGVGLFFLISGFVITPSFERSTRKGYLIRRFFRLYPTYFVCFTLTIIALAISSYYFQRQFPHSFKEIIIHYIIGLRDILASKSIDGVIWTLEIEVKFYLLCMIFAPYFKSGSKYILGLPILLFLFQLLLKKGTLGFACIVSYSNIFLIYMFIGVAMYYYYKKYISLKLLSFLIIFYFVLFFFTYKFFDKKSYFCITTEYIKPIILFGVFWIFRNFVEKRLGFLNYIADISYPVYAVHGVLGYVVMRILLDQKFTQGFVILITTLLVLVLSYLIHIYFEVPSNNLGASIAKTKFGN